VDLRTNSDCFITLERKRGSGNILAMSYENKEGMKTGRQMDRK
jgi:hypothetical protein